MSEAKFTNPLKGAVVSINDYALTSFERPNFDIFIVTATNEESFGFLHQLRDGEHLIKTVSDCGIYSSATVRLFIPIQVDNDCIKATFEIVYDYSKSLQGKPKGGYYEIC